MSASDPEHKTQRYRLGELLRDTSDHILLLTATPHRGDRDNFSFFLRLLDADVFANVKSIRQAMERRRAPFYLRRTKEAMVHFPHRQPDGAWACRKIFTRRIPHTADFRIDGPEFELYRDITRFVKRETARAAALGDDPRARIVDFLISLFQRRLASLSFALQRSLEKRAARLEDSLRRAQDITHARPPDFLRTFPDPDELEEMEDADRERLEEQLAQYAVVARLRSAFRRLLPGLRYEAVNRDWEMADIEHRPHGWPQARPFVAAQRFIPEEEAQTTLFTLGPYVYRAWVTNMSLTSAGIWHFHHGRACMEPRIGELREAFALRKIPTASFPANALYLEIIPLAHNLLTTFQRNSLRESWQNLTLTKLRYKLFLLPGELTRPPNRPVLRLRESLILRDLADDVLTKLGRVKPLQC